MGVQQMDPQVAESVAGVVRLLGRASALVWQRADAEGPSSSRQVIGLGIDVACDEARALLDDSVSLEGPIPVGEDPAGLLMSASRLLGLLCADGAPAGVYVLQSRVVELVWEVSSGAGA